MRPTTIALPLLLAANVLAAGCSAESSPAAEEDCEGGKCDEGVMGKCGPVLDRSMVPANTTVVTVKIGADGVPVSQHTAFSFTGSALSEYVSYDSEGRLAKELWTQFDDAGGVDTTPGFGYTYSYAGGRLSRRQELLDNGGETTDYSYTDTGDLVQAKITTSEPASEKVVDYQAHHNSLHNWLELVETEKGGTVVTEYAFNKRFPAEWPASIRIGDSALTLGTTIDVDHSLISMTRTDDSLGIGTTTTIFHYDSMSEDYLVRADVNDIPAFFVSYECAEAKK